VISGRIKTRSLADQAFEQIVTAIERGELEPGSRIGEIEVAAQLGISRGPLREALARLEACSLVVRRPNRGVFVAQASFEAFLELSAMREALEGMACRLAAERMTTEELDSVRRLLERHGDNPDVRAGVGYYQGISKDDFHFQIVRASRNGRLVHTLCNDLYHQLRFYRYRSSVRAGRSLAALDEHWAVVAALEARDPDRAEASMRAHIRNGRPPAEEAGR